jgi:hypothetical protein
MVSQSTSLLMFLYSCSNEELAVSELREMMQLNENMQLYFDMNAGSIVDRCTTKYMREVGI